MNKRIVQPKMTRRATLIELNPRNVTLNELQKNQSIHANAINQIASALTTENI